MTKKMYYWIQAGPPRKRDWCSRDALSRLSGDGDGTRREHSVRHTCSTTLPPIGCCLTLPPTGPLLSLPPPSFLALLLQPASGDG